MFVVENIIDNYIVTSDRINFPDILKCIPSILHVPVGEQIVLMIK